MDRRTSLRGLAALTLPFALPPLLARRRSQEEPPQVALAAPRTLILVRHAEKAADDPRDPSLSAAGEARAEALARLLARARPSRLVASEFRRTQATLAPLARALGLAIDTVPAGSPEVLLESLAAAGPGATWIVAGHSNTLPDLARRAGVTLHDLQAGEKGPVIADEEYARLFVVSLPAGPGCAPGLLELRYGV